MIRISDKIDDMGFSAGSFSDNTHKLEVINHTSDLNGKDESSNVYITWLYENDGELFELSCLVSHLRNLHPEYKFFLDLPYVPNARMDRPIEVDKKRGIDRICTLKWFAQEINALKFDKVTILEPHSDASSLLLDRCRTDTLDDFFKRVVASAMAVGSVAVVYPDVGSQKRYEWLLASGDKSIGEFVGFKTRDSNDNIEKYDFREIGKPADSLSGRKTAIIRDDICSSGSTIMMAARPLKQKGYSVWAFVAHFQGTASLANGFWDCVDRVYTTDSICADRDDRIKLVRSYRGNASVWSHGNKAIYRPKEKK